MRKSQYDYEGKPLTKCADCGFILPSERKYYDSTCTDKHMSMTVRLDA